MKRVFLFICVFLLNVNFLTAQWVLTSGSRNTRVRAFAVTSNGTSGTNLFVGTDGGILLSTNNGTIWNNVLMSGTNALAVTSNGTDSTNLFAGGGGVFRSTNNGISWTAVDSGLAMNQPVSSLAASSKGTSNTDLFVGTYGNGVFLSTNNGTSWTAVNYGLQNTVINSLAVSDTNLIAATNGGIFLSTNNGTSWTNVNTTGLGIGGPFAISGTNIFAAGLGVFLSTNNGLNWTAADSGIPYGAIYSLAASDKYLFADAGDDIFLSTNNGTSWNSTNSFYSSNPTGVNTLVVSDSNLFAGTVDGGIWRRPLSDIVTGIKDIKKLAPTHYSLEQNYPNPFNPSTSIGYQLAGKSHVTLKVYDLLGRELATLVDEVKSSGSYTATFNASSLPSGVFFYRLTTNAISSGQTQSFSSVKKMLLLK